MLVALDVNILRPMQWRQSAPSYLSCVQKERLLAKKGAVAFFIFGGDVRAEQRPNNNPNKRTRHGLLPQQKPNHCADKGECAQVEQCIKGFTD